MQIKELKHMEDERKTAENIMNDQPLFLAEGWGISLFLTVQATIMIIFLFTEHTLIMCQPFYVTYLNLFSQRPYVVGTIITSISQMSKLWLT